MGDVVLSGPCAAGDWLPVCAGDLDPGIDRRGVGIGGARRVLVKGGAFIELPARLQAIAMDKTGTITRGEPQVVNVVTFSGHSEEELLARAAALEVRSTHPLARAIVRFAETKGVSTEPAENVQVLRGKGLTGTFNDTLFWLGSHRYVIERGQSTEETTD